MLAIRNIPQTMLEAFRAGYHFISPLFTTVMQSSHVNTAISTVAGGLIVSIGNTITNWLSSDKESLKECKILIQIFIDKFAISKSETKNITILAAKVNEFVEKCLKFESNKKDLKDLFNGLEKKSGNFLNSPYNNNDVRKSMIESGLEKLPAFNGENFLEISTYVHNWFVNTAVCQRRKLDVLLNFEKCETRENLGKIELTTCKSTNENLSKKNDNLRKEHDVKNDNLRNEYEKKIEDLRDKQDQVIRDLQKENTACKVQEQVCKTKLHKCENRGFFG
jgi:hypothetical protein